MLKADIFDILESSSSEKEVSDAVVGGTSRATSFQSLIEIDVDITAMISTIMTLGSTTHYVIEIYRLNVTRCGPMSLIR